MSRLRVKMILPALTEATSPFWRPIKYSLFPPLGLATLAGYLPDDAEVEIQDEHVERLSLDDAPDLVVIQVYITSARRAYAIADHYRQRGAYVALGGLHVTSLPAEAALHADTIFLGPGEDTWPRFLRGLSSRLSGARLPVDAPDAGGPASHPPRPDQAPPLPGAQLDRRLARVPARLRLLLQGSVLRGRKVLLHADGRCRARGDRAAARPASLFPRRPSVRRPPFRHGALRRHARHGASVAGRRHGERGARARAARAGRGGGPSKPLRRVRDAEPGQSRRTAEVPEHAARLRCRHPSPARPRRDDQRQLRLRHGRRRSVGVRADGRVGHRARHRDGDVSHPHAVPGHGALPPHRGSGPAHGARLGPVRHASRGVPARRECRARSSRKATGGPIASSTGGDRLRAAPPRTPMRSRACATWRTRQDGRSSSRCGTSSSGRSEQRRCCPCSRRSSASLAAANLRSTGEEDSSSL